MVVGKRIARKEESLIKRLTANAFYKFINKISNIPIPSNVGDFRLINKEVLGAINLMPENCRFMKGIFSYVGFKICEVPYERPARKIGKSKFGMIRLWNFALEGITSFSTLPLRCWTYIGFLISAMSLMVAMFFLLRTLFFGVDVPGYASIIFSSTFLGGIQLLGIGIIGEYLGRVYMESKQRPPYFIKKIYK